jgi:hypothetical protein
MVWIVLGGFVLAIMAVVGVTVVGAIAFLFWLLARHLVHVAAERLGLDGKKPGHVSEPHQPVAHT